MSSRKRQILVVDDEVRSLELMRRILRPIANVMTAASAEEAWKIVQDNDLDLLITDQRMPGAQGVDLLSQAADRDETMGRILLTGYTDLASITDAINLGRVHGYLSKPCNPDDVVERVETVLARVDHARSRERLARSIEKLNESTSGGRPSDS
jgi:two-component system response regulator HupR/HoxA